MYILVSHLCSLMRSDPRPGIDNGNGIKFSVMVRIGIVSYVRLAAGGLVRVMLFWILKVLRMV